MQSLDRLDNVNVSFDDALNWFEVLVHLLIQTLLFILRLQMSFYEYFIDVNLLIFRIICLFFTGFLLFLVQSFPRFLIDPETFYLNRLFG